MNWRSALVERDMVLRIQSEWESSMRETRTELSKSVQYVCSAYSEKNAQQSPFWIGKTSPTPMHRLHVMMWSSWTSGKIFLLATKLNVCCSSIFIWCCFPHISLNAKILRTRFFVWCCCFFSFMGFSKIVCCIFTVAIVCCPVDTLLMSSYHIVIVSPLLFEYSTGVLSVHWLPLCPSTHPPWQWRTPKLRDAMLHVLVFSLKPAEWTAAPRGL